MLISRTLGLSRLLGCGVPSAVPRQGLTWRFSPFLGATDGWLGMEFRQTMQVATDASQVRPGMLIEFENKIWEVLDSGTRKSARGRSNTTLDLKELGPAGRKKSLTLRTVDSVEVVELENMHTVFVSAVELDADAQQKLKAGKPVSRMITVREEDTDNELDVDTNEIGCAHLVPYMFPGMPIRVCTIDDRYVQLK